MIKKITLLSVMLIFLSSNYNYSINNDNTKLNLHDLKNTLKENIPSKSNIAAFGWITACCVVVYIGVKQIIKSRRARKEIKDLINLGLDITDAVERSNNLVHNIETLATEMAIDNSL